jgi:hypothetical protein
LKKQPRRSNLFVVAVYFALSRISAARPDRLFLARRRVAIRIYAN